MMICILTAWQNQMSGFKRTASLCLSGGLKIKWNMIQMRVSLIKPPRTLFVLSTCLMDETLLDETIYLFIENPLVYKKSKTL